MKPLSYFVVLTTPHCFHFSPLPVCLSPSPPFFISFFCLPIFKSVSSWPVWDFITLALVITSQLWSCWYRRNKRMKKKGRVEKSDRWNVGQWRCAPGSFSLCFSVCLSLPGPRLKRLKETRVKVPLTHTCLSPASRRRTEAPAEFSLRKPL